MQHNTQRISTKQYATEGGEEQTEEPMESTPDESSSPPPAQERLPDRKRLDPLLVSVTRNNDPNYDSTPKTNLPLLGEVTMDRSLFLIVPAALFTVLGVGASLLVLLSSGDAFVDAVQQTAAEASNMNPVAGDTCRGLCSSQEQDLESLRSFMQGLSGK
jgi:hypothetical protein